MAKRVQFRRGTSTQHGSFTGVVGEVTVDTTLKTLRVHDSSTVGGSVLATKTYVDSGISSVEGSVTAIGNSVTALNNNTVNLNGTQTISGIKTFTTSPLVVTPTVDSQAVPKKYVDDRIRQATRTLAVGDGLVDSTGEFNLAVGMGVLRMNTSGAGNTAVGIELMRNNTTGSNNTAVGANSLQANITGNANTGVGVLTLSKLTSGIENVAVGAAALRDNTGSSRNTAVGSVALSSLTVGSSNVAIGHSAMELSTSSFDNIAIGYQALRNNTTGTNIGLGTRSLTANTTGDDNIAVGYQSLKSNTTGNNNVAVGNNSLESNKTGNYNVALGLDSMPTNIIGNYNVALGANTLYYNKSEANTGVGTKVLYANTTGTDNTGVGIRAIENNTTGSFNSAIGSDALYHKIDGTMNTNFSNCTGVGAKSRVSNSNQVQLGDSLTTTFAYGAVQNRSDRRDKADIRDTTLGLDFIMNIRPVDFKWNYRDSYIETITNEDGETEVIQLENDGSKTRSRYHHGVIAQEVKEVIDTMGVDFGGYQDHSMNEGGCDVLSVGYEEFIAPMIKAIQELKKEIEVLKDTLNKNEESEL